MGERMTYYAHDLGIVDEPLAVALLKYRQDNRRRVQIPRTPPHTYQELDRPNLISSRTTSGRHMPILDLDFPHHYEQSTADGHSHLYLDVEISNWRWFWLMVALRQAGIIELGFFAWSLRRWGNFVRLPHVKKILPEEDTKPTYGWFFPLRKSRSKS